MKIFVASQLRVTLDSIRNSCNVYIVELFFLFLESSLCSGSGRESSRRVKVGMRLGARTERNAAGGFLSMIGSVAA